MSATAFQRMRREQANKEQEENKVKTLDHMTVAELKVIAKEKGIEGCDRMKKADIIAALQQLEELPKGPDKELDKEPAKE